MVTKFIYALVWNLPWSVLNKIIIIIWQLKCMLDLVSCLSIDMHENIYVFHVLHYDDNKTKPLPFQRQ